MEVKARKKRELSAEPAGKTHRCIPRYIRALGKKHETSTAFNSIHTSLSLFLFLPPLSRVFNKCIQKRKKESNWKCYKKRALSVTVAMEVRKRRIRAHLQQRVKMWENEAREVEVMDEEKEEEEKRRKIRKREERKYSITGSTGLNLPKGCRLFHESLAESPQKQKPGRPVSSGGGFLCLDPVHDGPAVCLSVSLCACLPVSYWLGVRTLSSLCLCCLCGSALQWYRERVRKRARERERARGSPPPSACRRFDCFQMCVCLCVCARERGRERGESERRRETVYGIVWNWRLVSRWGWGWWGGRQRWWWWSVWVVKGEEGPQNAKYLGTEGSMKERCWNLWECVLQTGREGESTGKKKGKVCLRVCERREIKQDNDPWQAWALQRLSFLQEQTEIREVMCASDLSVVPTHLDCFNPILFFG